MEGFQQLSGTFFLTFAEIEHWGKAWHTTAGVYNARLTGTFIHSIFFTPFHEFYFAAQ